MKIYLAVLILINMAVEHQSHVECYEEIKTGKKPEDSMEEHKPKTIKGVFASYNASIAYYVIGMVCLYFA